MKVADFYGPHQPSFYQCLRDEGFDGIARYLVLVPGADPRAITPGEVEAAHAAGLSIQFFFEMNPTYAAYFSYGQGIQDGRAALAHLRQLGAPLGTVVYFAVDAPVSKIPVHALDPYFTAVEQVLSDEGGGLIVPGLYGFQAHCEYARRHYPNVGKHVWQTYGIVTGTLDGWQHEQYDLCGVSIDESEVLVPGWKKEEYVLPQRVGQSADMAVHPGEVVSLQAFFQYEDGRRIKREKKYWSHRPGRYVEVIRPQVDPGADETEHLDAEPAIFIIDVITQ